LVNSFSPPDNSTTAPANTNLLIYFNQNILKGTGNLLIKRYAYDAVVETIDVAGSRVSVSGNVATIDPVNDLEAGVMYYVEIPNTAFRNASSQFYAGTANKDTWNFSVSDNVAPNIVSLEPADNSEGVPLNADLRITFSEPINRGTGSITIRRADNSVKQTLSVNNLAVNVSGSIVTIDISDLEQNTDYYVQMPAGTFRDLANNNFAGITDNTTWNFSTRPPASLVMLSKGKLLIYPNPTKGKIFLRLENGMNIEKAEVWNVLGQKLSDLQVKNNQEISLDHLPAAMYLLKLQISGEIVQQRIIKQ
jgi:methionine-rich copper-binding protein CopC